MTYNTTYYQSLLLDCRVEACNSKADFGPTEHAYLEVDYVSKILYMA